MNPLPIIFSLFNHDELCQLIHKKIPSELGVLLEHYFPDGETLIEYKTNIKQKKIIFVTSLNFPNEKILPLIFAAETAKKLGASHITLVAPYLAYMRQDKQFKTGQGITSEYFAKLISCYFDVLITIDPHLHRWHQLSDIYSIPSYTLHASTTIAYWLKKHIANALLIGPDQESTQWVEAIAKQANLPYHILTKERLGDRDIKIIPPQKKLSEDRTPVLIDDIISSGHTLLETIQCLHQLKLKPPVCIGVHAIFADQAYDKLKRANINKIITCNTIQHCSNEIDISDLLVDGIKQSQQNQIV